VVDTINQESDFALLSDYLTTMVSDPCMQSQWKIVVSELGKTRDLELRVQTLDQMKHYNSLL
jgi:hypothetical protein